MQQFAPESLRRMGVSAQQQQRSFRSDLGAPEVGCAEEEELLVAVVQTRKSRGSLVLRLPMFVRLRNVQHSLWWTNSLNP